MELATATYIVILYMLPIQQISFLHSSVTIWDHSSSITVSTDFKKIYPNRVPLLTLINFMAYDQYNRYIFFSFFFVFMCSVDAFQFRVGGKDGWTLNPSEKYAHWAARMRFQVSDTLCKCYGSILFIGFFLKE